MINRNPERFLATILKEIITMSENETIKQCSIVLTRDCNLRCNFCYVKDAGYCRNDMMSFENIKKIVDFCSDAKVKFIFFTGGEPLLYPQIIDILSYIKEQEHPIITAVATNGIMLKDKQFCEKLIESGLSYIDVSMKGRDSQEWIGTTGCDGYNAQQEAIRNLASLPIEFTCSMVVTSDSVMTLCESVKNAFENGAKQFSFTFVIDNDDNPEKNKTYLENHNPLKLIDAFISQMDQLNSITDDWWIEYSFPMCVYTEKQLLMLEGRLASPCQIHKQNAVTFDTHLNLLPCDMYFNNKIGRLGEDFSTTEEFVRLREQNPYKEVIDEISKLPSKECQTCKHFEECYGGCPVLWKNYSFEDLEKFKAKYR